MTGGGNCPPSPPGSYASAIVSLYSYSQSLELLLMTGMYGMAVGKLLTHPVSHWPNYGASYITKILYIPCTTLLDIQYRYSTLFQLAYMHNTCTVAPNIHDIVDIVVHLSLVEV